MSQEEVVLTQWACIFICWAGFRFSIHKAPLSIFGFIGCVFIGTYAGHGIMLYKLLMNNPSAFSRIEWSTLYIIQSIFCVIAIAYVVYAGIMLIARIITLFFESLKKLYKH